MRAYHLASAEHALEDITLKRIKIALIGDLNDPFELMAGELSDPRLRRSVKKLKNQWEKGMGLLCFSRSWSNPVLWSHYAAKHTGICLGFDIADKFVVPINYRNSRLSLAINREYVEKIISTKYLHWKYENEVRMYIGLDEATKENGLFFYPFDASVELREVILGPMCRSPLEDIRQLVSKYHDSVTVFKARMAFRNFNIVADQRSLRKRA
jgi:Protein of unknown function (DUF2971)